MYTAFYGLREKPFALSPDPRYLYLAGSHREALAHLLYGIEQGEGFISVTGEVGTGKTTLCRTLLERLDAEADGSAGRTTELAYLFNPSRTALELLQSICAEFDLPAEGLARRTLMAQLDSFLVEQKRQGRRVLLIIDEAQTLSENTLEQVRLLSNLETSREKLIQILLLGQPELDRKLNSRALRQLRQRISVRWKLQPLTAEETRAYVRHRIEIAGGTFPNLFSDAALKDIHRRTGGIPRLINQLCDRALLAGYAAEMKQIGPALVRAAAKEIPDARRAGEREIRRSPWLRPWMAVAASVAVVAMAAVAGLSVGRHGLTNASRLLFSPSGVSEVAGVEVDEASTNSDASSPRESQQDTRGRLAAADTGRRAPASVSANAPGSTSADGPLARKVGYVTPDGLVDGSTPGSIASESAPATGARTDGFVSAARALPIPTPPRAEVTALAPGVLKRLLANRDAQSAMAESQRSVLEAFGRRIPGEDDAPTNTSALSASLEDRGLTATAFDGGSLELLRRLDHPVLLPLRSNGRAARAERAERPGGGTSPNASAGSAEPDRRWVAVLGFSGDRARLAGLLGEQLVTVEVDELAEHWLETGIIVWERFEPVPEIVLAGETGRGVLWIQRALAELSFLNGGVFGRFDDETRNALIEFQKQRGLVADGIAGPLTQIALYAQLDRYPVPRLSGAAGVTDRDVDDPDAVARPAVGANREASEPGRSTTATGNAASGERG